MKIIQDSSVLVNTSYHVCTVGYFDGVHLGHQKIIEKLVTDASKNKGKSILTSINHQTGTDRVYEVFKGHLNSEPNLIINLQGDMPNIEPQSISDLINYMQKGNCDIGTLASSFSSDNELADENNVKVAVKGQLIAGKFSEAIDFFRVDKKKYENFHHHIGIYAFTSASLSKYVKLARSKLEIERKLEQMRAIENNMVIRVGFSDTTPLGVDTEKDLQKISEEIV